MPENGWSAYEKLVLAELQDHKKYLITLDRRSQEHGRRIAVLQVKAGVWGVLGGILAVIAAAMMKVL